MDELRTSVIIDYQNLHLTGHGLFQATKYLPRHETLVDPLRFANLLIERRNASQRDGYPKAALHHVFVFRGEPSPEHDPDGYSRNQAQRANWERDSRVVVTLRPLKYRYDRDGRGRISTDVNGQKILVGPPQEKGVDVLCALALVREARNSAVDLVILASSDSDLAPALDEVQAVGSAKVETFCWYDERGRLGYQLHPTNRSRPIWNTRLNEADFVASRDTNDYS